MKQQMISVVGDVMLDEYCDGNVTKFPLKPQFPSLILFQAKKLGGAANVAKNIAGYGAECYLFGLIGNDNQGKDLQNLIQSNGIIDKCRKLENFQTIQKTRIVSGQIKC